MRRFTTVQNVFKVFLLLVASLFCVQTALAEADPWSYPKTEPDGNFGGGDGTEASPYLITNAQQLADLAYMVNDGTYYKGKYFKLTRDIQLSDISFEDGSLYPTGNIAKRWEPIGREGSFWNDSFKGIFDGDNHTISGMVVSSYSEFPGSAPGKFPSYYYEGLFGALDGAIVRNLNMKDCFIYQGKNAIATGFLAGYMSQSQIINCHVNGCRIVVKSPDLAPRDATNSKTVCIGGIVGQGSGSGKTFNSCSFDGKISVTIDYMKSTSFLNWGRCSLYVSGLMGLGASTLEKCQSNGTIDINATGDEDDGDIMVSGLCYEAENVTCCKSGMNFNLNSEGNIANGKALWLYTLCHNGKNISRSAATGTITVGSNQGWKGELGNVKTATSVTDCAFYTKVNGTFATKASYGYKLDYCPLGSTDKATIDDVKRVVMSNGDKAYFSTPDDGYLSRTGGVMPSGKSKLYETTAIDMKSDKILADLNADEDKTMVWGKINDDKSAFYEYLFPLALGNTASDQLKGEGTEASPYLIGSREDLLTFANFVNSGKVSADDHFALSNDIDMTGSAEIDPIGTSDHPFNGTFDGKEFAISNLKAKNGLFNYMGGTLKNLAVINAELTPYGKYMYYGSLVAHLVNGGQITSCYAGGDITVSKITDIKTLCVGGLCGSADEGKISNSYFKGRINIKDGDATNNTYLIGGLVGCMYHLDMTDCYASFEADGGTRVSGLAGERYAYQDVFMGLIKNCCYVCSQATGYDYNDTQYTRPDGEDVTPYDNDGDIFGNKESLVWGHGAFRPVLKAARHYLTEPSSGNRTSYYDAIPMADSKNPNNEIYHIDATGHEGDKLMWALPNLAIYNKADKTDYILNCTLDPKKSLGYSKKETQTVKVDQVKINMHYPFTIEAGKQRYYTLCLPGTVYRDAFPDGTELYIGGELKTDNQGKYIDIVRADSVECGVPFVAYIPYASANKTIDIVMRSRMAVDPATSVMGNPVALKGTYLTFTASGVCNNIVENDGMPYMGKVEGEQKILPFTAYLPDEEQVYLRNYLLLDDTGTDIEDVLEENNGKTVKVMFKRNFKKGVWSTICLPTEYSPIHFGSNTQMEELSSAEITSDGVCTLHFKKVIFLYCKPGKSYLIKPETINDNGIYNFDDATTVSNEIKPTELTIDGTNATIKFCGTFGRKMLGKNEDGADEYFIQDNKILHVADGQQIKMNGFRCYITANKTAATALSKARIVHSDGTTTDLRLVEVGSSADGSQRVYNLQGMEQGSESQQHGVYIKGGRKYVK